MEATTEVDFYTDMQVVLQMAKDDGKTFNAYDILLKKLCNKEEKADVVIKLLGDLEQHVTLLTQDYQSLVYLIMGMDWLDRGPELITAYKAFILNLVSAQTFYLKPLVRKLVKSFVPDLTVLSVPESESYESIRQKLANDLMHIHSLLNSLSQLVPVTQLLLGPILEEYFPYINKGVLFFEYYTRGLLTVSQYMPALRLQILELLIKNMLKLDVRSSRLDINTALCLSDTLKEEVEDTQFDVDIDSASGANDKVAPGVSKEAKETQFNTALPLAGSLDAMMSLCLEYIRDTCFTSATLDWNATKKLYRELLSIFDKYIFLTHASCHVQFLLFHVCSLKEALADGFIDYLWKKITDPTNQSIYRQTAACYIGSFLTRAKYVSINTAKEVMELMLKWIHKYIDQTGEGVLHADIAHHGTFYSVCQSAFYIFCFKHNDFMQLKKGFKWAESLNFQRVITCKLNPLRVCVPIIVKTFASATRLHQLAFCDTIIERNNRYYLPVAVCTNSIEVTAFKQLDSYFPFDPYLLPRSSSHISPLYHEFQGSLPDEEEDIDEDVDDFLPDEEEEPKHMSSSMPKGASDFLAYGISPGFQHG
ncbi:RNA polymerase I-specific transcription initiation factor RRN3 [Biomphalaria pfeifferi]|uniref:RNA polymerase I-specific transcription initiation factor RRN3 n=1 Tax=Biomphalaria pfeifferi TaxID=112525 RepID=A0AAD8BBT8_BIOPF|nr:RNA polymerase I-specific transcription initiation factor RRN3 [Biomphalaria pfeifferi]